jgi:hypothetical protein
MTDRTALRQLVREEVERALRNRDLTDIEVMLREHEEHRAAGLVSDRTMLAQVLTTPPTPPDPDNPFGLVDGERVVDGGRPLPGESLAEMDSRHEREALGRLRKEQATERGHREAQGAILDHLDDEPLPPRTGRLLRLLGVR